MASYFFKAGILGGGLCVGALAAMGCGSSASTAGEGGGTTTSTTTTTATTTTTTATTTTTTSSGGAVVVGSSFDSPFDVVIGGDVTSSSLPTPATSADYFRFDGTKGQAIVIFTSAQTGATGFSAAYLDTVVTLYDATKTKIAENNNGKPNVTNDSSLYTILPATGTYYFRIADCTKVLGASACGPVASITNFDYEASVIDVSKLSSATREGAEPNDTTATATTAKYAASGTASKYYRSELYGIFDTLTDVDVFAITLPADEPTTSGTRPVGFFYPDLSGVSGNGSGASVGEMWIVDSADLTHHYADIDVSTDNTLSRYLSPPMILAHPYYLFVKRAAGTTVANDFYFVAHNGGSSNQLEAHDSTNGTPGGAEALTQVSNSDGTFSYYVEGDLGTGDSDNFSVAVPSTLSLKQVLFTCKAQRGGSGLRGATFSLLAGSTGNAPLKTSTSTNATVVETATTDATISAVPIPSTETTLVFQVSATGQDANVTTSFYRCGLRLQ